MEAEITLERNDTKVTIGIGAADEDAEWALGLLNDLAGQVGSNLKDDAASDEGPSDWRVRAGVGYYMGWSHTAEAPRWFSPGRGCNDLEGLPRLTLAEAADHVRGLRDQGWDAWVVYDPPPGDPAESFPTRKEGA